MSRKYSHARPGWFEGYGTILELLEKDRFLVEMPNGHRVYGVIQKNKNRIVRLKTGDKVATFLLAGRHGERNHSQEVGMLIL